MEFDNIFLSSGFIKIRFYSIQTINLNLTDKENRIYLLNLYIDCINVDWFDTNRFYLKDMIFRTNSTVLYVVVKTKITYHLSNASQ
jgi:hypothetical protein